ncbi:MAG: 2OG-Fe(II) oxygenase [Dongiaceae bacterium]
MRNFKPIFNDNFSSFASVTNFFTPAECNRIIELGLGLESSESTVQADQGKANVPGGQARQGSVAWIKSSATTEPLFARLEKIATEVNDKAFKFSLVGFGEPIQFTYYDRTGDHYAWHQDHGPGRMSCRKLSIVVQLSDPAGYIGGNLQLMVSGAAKAMPRDRGSVVIFPSWQVHRVTPLESGLRYSLVAWIWGEGFR